jgi:hypothetical protein
MVVTLEAQVAVAVAVVVVVAVAVAELLVGAEQSLETLQSYVHCWGSNLAMN